MKSDRYYVRVYHDDLIRDYAAIYADDAALATWLRLLVLADKMWPTPAEFPRSVKARPLRALMACGLVELVQPHSYRIRGHDAERTKRQDAARNAAAGRWDAKGNADSNAGGIAEPMPSRAENENEPKVTPPPAKLGLRKNGTNQRALGNNPRAKGESPRQKKVAEKRGGMESLTAILNRANAEGRS